MPPPPGTLPERWGTLELFGADRDKPDERDGAKGLVHFVLGGQVLRLGAGQAVIKRGSGERWRYVRRPLPRGAAPLWRLGTGGTKGQRG